MFKRTQMGSTSAFNAGTVAWREKTVWWKDNHSGESERTACLLSLLIPLTWTVNLPDQMNNTRTGLLKKRNLKLVGYVCKLRTSMFDHALNVYCLKLASLLVGLCSELNYRLTQWTGIFHLNDLKRSRKSYSGKCSLRKQPQSQSRSQSPRAFWFAPRHGALE